MENIKITLETLYDILRNEKKKEDLQKIDNSFFIDVVSYLREKKVLLDIKSESDELFAAGEREKVEYEMRSIKRILKEIYEKREKKIIDIAMNKSRTGSDIIDTSAMLREEKEFYEKILNILDFYRRGVLLNLFHGKLPDVSDPMKRADLLLDRLSKRAEAASTSSNNFKISSDKPATFSKFEGAPIMVAEEENDNSKTTSSETTPPETTNSETLPPEETEPQESSEEGDEEQESEQQEQQESSDKQQDKSETKQETKQEKTSVRFIHPMPSFVWKDMKVYGPFDKGEEVKIFPEVADLLVRKGRAEKI